MLLDPQRRRPPVRNQANAGEAGGAHAVEHRGGRAGDHVSPVPDQFDGRFEQGHGRISDLGEETKVPGPRRQGGQADAPRRAERNFFRQGSCSATGGPGGENDHPAKKLPARRTRMRQNVGHFDRPLECRRRDIGFEIWAHLLGITDDHHPLLTRCQRHGVPGQAQRNREIAYFLVKPAGRVAFD